MGSLKYIYRDERPGFYGWLVKMKRKKREHLKYFNDGEGDPPESLRRAIAYRNRLIQDLPPPTKIMTTHARNTSGVIGVSREISTNSAGNLAENWIAQWVELNGKVRRRAFSVNKYGEEDAKAMAIAARREAVQRLLSEGRRKLLSRVLSGPADRRARRRRVHRDA